MSYKFNYKSMSIEQLIKEYERVSYSANYDELKQDRLDCLKIEFAIKANIYLEDVLVE